MPDQSEIINLSTGNPVDHFLLIRKFEIRNTKAGKKFLSLELGDQSSSIGANVWNDTSGFEKVSEGGKVGAVVKVAGTIDEFLGTPQVKVNSIRLATESDRISPKDFLPKSSLNLEKMKTEFLTRINKISDKNLKTLLNSIFSGNRLENFITAPAGKSWHHAYIHGLIEHTLELIKICDLMCDFHNELNRDILIAGAMLHDLGKTEELSYDSAFGYTDKGKLIGHIVICASLVEEEIKKLPEFPEELKNLLIHLILSHQGKLEYASPVVPKTPEAIALYQADELSAKVNAYIGTIKTEVAGEGNWTKFVQLAQTEIYKYSDEPERENNKSLFD